MQHRDETYLLFKIALKTLSARWPSGLENKILNQNLVLGSNLSLPDERSNRETSHRIGFYSVYLVSLQGLPFIQLYFIYIDLHRLHLHQLLFSDKAKFCGFRD